MTIEISDASSEARIRKQLQANGSVLFFLRVEQAEQRFPLAFGSSACKRGKTPLGLGI
jgi:hypothetical protein